MINQLLHSWKMSLQVRLLLCVGTHVTDLTFSAFTLLKLAIRDNVSDTSNLQSELITQPETPISVSLSLVRQVISKELLRHICLNATTPTLFTFFPCHYL